MSAQEMNSLLHDLKIQYKESGQWLLYKRHHDKGYTHSQTVNITHKDGANSVKMNTKWTQKGRLFIYERLKKEGILPVIEWEDF
jgi:phage antirepressor YoqD-like protein